LAIVGDRAVIAGSRRIRGGPASSAIEQRFTHTCSHCPETDGPIEPVQQGGPFQASESGQIERWEVGRPRYSNLFVGGCHAAFGRCNIGTPLQKLRWQDNGHRR
jgi:hypothetical protein